MTPWTEVCKELAHNYANVVFPGSSRDEQSFEEGFVLGRADTLERVKGLVEALVKFNSISKHTCNIEYGNMVGVENCAVCKALYVLGKFEKEIGE